MSGRSAHVRKKITETKAGERTVPSRGRALSSAASSDDNATISEFAMPPPRQGTGVATINARFLKFSEPIRESETLNFHNDLPTSYANHSSDSQSGGSVDSRRDPTAPPHFKGPLDDFAYARARRPNIKTEDVSGIEKSGLRSVVDKKSDEVRKGLAKAFNFRKKDRRGGGGGDIDRALEFRPQSSATVRPGANNYLADHHHHQHHADAGYDSFEGGAAAAAAAAGGGRPSPHAVQTYDQSAWDAGTGLAPPPSAKLPPVPPPATAPPIKRWIGAGRPVQRWNKLRKDPELWDPNGDVLVFFGHRGQQPRPNPSFRLSSHIIEATESRFLVTLLREGSTEEDIQLPPSPIGAPPMLHRHLAAGGPGRGIHHHHLQQHLQQQQQQQQQQQHQHHRIGPHIAYGAGQQPTPPISEDTSLGEADGQISYEMYFPTPPNTTKIDQIRHHITTRNVFALLYHASLVGLSLYQALTDLHMRLETYMPPEADNIGTIMNYLGARGIDDVRNDAEAAVSLVAWAERPEVRWEEGWRESFLHCAGMFSSLEACADFKNITPITRALLERACLETQLRVQAAEERLADFAYGDMWPSAFATTASSSGPVTTSTAKAAADRLQKFFLAHYTRVYGRWPPPPPPRHDLPPGMAMGDPTSDDMWLSRTVAQALQRDFAALYDFLVNRDIVWDGSEARSGRKWMLVSGSGNRAFDADTPDLPMTDMLVEFDNRLRFPHIPHPYPLVPESIPPSSSTTTGSSTTTTTTTSTSAAPTGREGKTFRKGNNGPTAAPPSTSTTTTARSGAVERRVQLAYTEATNMLVLGSDFTQSDLIDAFSKFEKIDRVGDVDPATARRGRWVLIYGVLQTLASVSVDAPNIRYRDDVSYHLSPRLKGAKMPPWKAGLGGGGGGGMGPGICEEASHELSHCWTVSRLWDAAAAAAAAASASLSSQSGNESAASSGGSGNTSPVHRGFHGFGGYQHHQQQRQQQQQHRSRSRPGTVVSSGTARSSLAGYHTPAGGGARSVRSSSSMGQQTTGSSSGGYHYPPPLSSAGSVISETDTAASSSVAAAARSSRRGRSDRDAAHRPDRYQGGAFEFESLDEMDWPTPASMAGSAGGVSLAAVGGYGALSKMGALSSPPILPPPPPVSSSPGGFLVLDDPASLMDDAKSFATAVSHHDRHQHHHHGGGNGEPDRAVLGMSRGGNGGGGGGGRGEKGSGRKGGGGGGGGGGNSSSSSRERSRSGKRNHMRPLLSRDGDESDASSRAGGGVPHIRDFDLDVIDDHEP